MATELVLDGYAAKTCTYALHLNQVEKALDRLPPSVLALARMEAGNEFEDAVGQFLVAIAPQDTFAFLPRDQERSIDEIKWSNDRTKRLAGTLRLMDLKTPVIWNPRLPPDPVGHKSGEPDLIMCVSNETEPPLYVPIDVKAHHALNARVRADGSVTVVSLFAGEDEIELQGPELSAHPEDLLQLAHYWRMLEAQGAAPPCAPFGAIIGTPSVEGELAGLTWFALDDVMEDYDESFAQALRVVERASAIANGSNEEPLGVAWYTTNCHDCSWRAVCGPQMLARRDVSLVRPSYHILDELDDFKITTIEELAHIDRSLTRSNGSSIASSTSWHESIRRAQLALAGDPIPFSLLPELNWPDQSLRLWRRAKTDPAKWALPAGDVELDVDMECTTNYCYLWGTLLTYRKEIETEQPPAGYRGFGDTFPIDIDRSEGDIFLSFWQFLQSLVIDCQKKDLAFRAYCYSSAENRWMRLCADRIDAERGNLCATSLRDQVEAFIESPMWVDLLPEMRQRTESLNGLGLKNAAKALGFHWHAKDAGGEASMLWYDYATSEPSADLRTKWAQQILQYNEDDVRATRHLRDWFATHSFEELQVVPD